MHSFKEAVRNAHIDTSVEALYWKKELDRLRLKALYYEIFLSTCAYSCVLFLFIFRSQPNQEASYFVGVLLFLFFVIHGIFKPFSRCNEGVIKLSELRSRWSEISLGLDLLWLDVAHLEDHEITKEITGRLTNLQATRLSFLPKIENKKLFKACREEIEQKNTRVYAFKY